MDNAYTLIDPQATLNYSFDWTTSYLAQGDNVVSYQWSSTPSGIIIAGDGAEQVLVGNCEVGKLYQSVVQDHDSGGHH